MLRLGSSRPRGYYLASISPSAGHRIDSSGGEPSVSLRPAISPPKACFHNTGLAVEEQPIV